jgi:hypothetical protein
MTTNPKATVTHADHAAQQNIPALIRDVLSVNWDHDDLERLRQLMTRAGIDLETAVQVFFNGAPQRFNMIAKPDLLPEAKARCNLLDSIHRRIVCGFYLPDPEIGLGQSRTMMQEWINRQAADGGEGRAGRWIFAPDILEHTTDIGFRPVVASVPVSAPTGRGFGMRLIQLIGRLRRIRPTIQ